MNQDAILRELRAKPEDRAPTGAEHVDALTGLPDRQAFVLGLGTALERHGRLPVAVIVIDLDHFKFVNDTVGQAAGDHLLAAAADRLRLQADAHAHAGLARMAGDEFAVWTVVDRPATALALAEQLRHALDQPFVIDGMEHFTSASIGVAVADEGSTAHTLIAEADTAMVTAKSTGGNGYAMFDAVLRARMAERTQALRDLNRAIQRQEIDLDVQPIIDLRDGTRSYEVLARWNHPIRGRLSPATFIQLAEESGLITRLGTQILEMGASHAAELGARVSVNVSARQFNRTLTQQVASLIARHGLAPGQLVIEITESAVVDNEHAQSVLDGLRRAGAHVWIDDFGTGYSSLSRLSALQVDGLKLPREFTEDLNSPQGWGIASAIVGIARALDIDVIAEGVETREQLALLRQLGCDAAQGYLLGRPRPYLQEHAERIAAADRADQAVDPAIVGLAGAVSVDPPHTRRPAAWARPTVGAHDRGLAPARTSPLEGDPDGTAVGVLWDNLPLGLIVVDLEGTIRIANARVATMTAHDQGDIVGRSLFDFIPDEDADFIVTTLASGADYPSKLLGPFRLRYRDRNGVMHDSEHWAYEAPDGLGFEGYVVTIAHESTADLLSSAFREIAAALDLAAPLATVARSMSAYPMEADGTVLLVEDGVITSAIGSWPYDTPNAYGDAHAPWSQAARGGANVTIAVADLPPHLRDQATVAGHGSLWLRAVDLVGQRRALLAAWHCDDRPPSANQERYMDEAVSVLALALAQDDHRRHLRHAALHDHLTGAGNRAKLDQDATTMLASFALFVDLDDFKAVNDRFGHAVGDMVLRTAAERLADATDGRARVYRVGGDEFALLFETDDLPTPSDASDVAASAVLAALHQPYPITDGCEAVVGASVGTACAGPGERAVHLLRRADDALLWAKRDGKGRHRNACGRVAV